MSVKSKIKSAIIRTFGLEQIHEVSRLTQATDAGEIVNESSALALSSVWACTNLIAGTTASLPFTVFREKDGEREPLKGHNLYRLLHDSPNFDQTALDFWEYISASLELWGNAYAAIERSNGKIVSLTPISPNLVVVKRLASGSLEYTWTFDGKYERRLEDGVFHIRGFGGSPLGGMSTLHFGRQAFGIARAIDKSAASTFKNGMQPSGALTFEDWLAEDQRALAKSTLTEQFLGAHNSGKPLILEGGTTWQSLSINPEDAQMLESRRFSVEEICRFFGVPPHMVGHTENSTSWGTGLEQQTLGFQKFTLRRRLKRIEQAVMKQLLTPVERANGVTVEFNLEGLLRGDSAARASYYQTMTQIGVMTINDVRRLENMPAVIGGDVPRMQMQNVPITEAGNGNDA